MAGYLRFLLAFLALPLAAAAAMVLVDVWCMAAATENFFSVRLASLAGGLVVFCALWFACSHGMTRAYVLGHELTHAVWAMAFGARASRLKVSASGGSVTLSKSNFLITLSPYFFPFYTVLVIMAALVTRIFVSPLPWPCAWLFAVGFTWNFHFAFTLRSLSLRQPDIVEYGRLFSWVLIWLLNLGGMILALATTTEVAFAGIFASICSRVSAAYLVVWRNLGYWWGILSV